MAELIEGFVHGLPPEGVARIVERAEGVPLYAVETVRMLADRGILEARSDAFELVGDLGTLGDPGDVAGVDRRPVGFARRRTTGCSCRMRRCWVRASPPRRSPPSPGRDREALEPRLRDLVKKEFLDTGADPRSPERGQYAFLQA